VSENRGSIEEAVLNDDLVRRMVRDIYGVIRSALYSLPCPPKPSRALPHLREYRFDRHLGDQDVIKRRAIAYDVSYLEKPSVAEQYISIIRSRVGRELDIERKLTRIRNLTN
jgi:hypothetical protein